MVSIIKLLHRFFQCCFQAHKVLKVPIVREWERRLLCILVLALLQNSCRWHDLYGLIVLGVSVRSQFHWPWVHGEAKYHSSRSMYQSLFTTCQTGSTETDQEGPGTRQSSKEHAHSHQLPSAFFYLLMYPEATNRWELIITIVGYNLQLNHNKCLCQFIFCCQVNVRAQIIFLYIIILSYL